MPRVTELWAWVVADSGGPDDEGVPAYVDADGFWRPMVGADRERIESLRPEAQRVANIMGKPVMMRGAIGLVEYDVVRPEPS